MMLGHGAFGGHLNNEGGALMNEISALIKRLQRDPYPFHYRKTQQKLPAMNHGHSLHENMTY